MVETDGMALPPGTMRLLRRSRISLGDPSVMWILILTFYVYGGGNATAIEFSSKERCMAAAEVMKNDNQVKNTYCVQK